MTLFYYRRLFLIILVLNKIIHHSVMLDGPLLKVVADYIRYRVIRIILINTFRLIVDIFQGYPKSINLILFIIMEHSERRFSSELTPPTLQKSRLFQLLTIVNVRIFEQVRNTRNI